MTSRAGRGQREAGDPIRHEALKKLRWRLVLPAIVYFVAAVVVGGLMGWLYMATALVAGGFSAIFFTRRGTRLRLLAQLLMGVAALVLAALSLGALGLSGAILVQGARGADLGFGGVFVLIGIPLGMGLGFAALTLASLALGGPRRRRRGSDGLSYNDPAALP